MPAKHALEWFAQAMKLWKRGPWAFSAIALVVLGVSIVLEPVPLLGFLAANVVAPLLAAGLLYASLAADRGDKPRMAHLIAIFAAPLSAQLAVVAAALAIFAAEWLAGWYGADINLLLPLDDAANLPADAIVTIYVAGVLASLPVTFVPMAALFDGESMGRAFSVSLRAFALNVPAFALMAAITFVLLLIGLMTTGIGLVLALPWLA
ncbi:MAG: hypothetical protein ABI624_10710, partial [Casimicrobiaceae bacterium]